MLGIITHYENANSKPPQDTTAHLLECFSVYLPTAPIADEDMEQLKLIHYCKECKLVQPH